MIRGLALGGCLLAFVVLATLNSAGYRYGASDQAFYLPAILERMSPGLFPRDSALIASQARLTMIDETVGGLADLTGGDLPVLFALLYALALVLLASGTLWIGRQLYATTAASLALLFALTLRHAITKTGTNTLEGYFHPRQLAFALGVLAVAAYLRAGGPWMPVALVALAAVLHPTTALWFMIWLGVSLTLSERRLRRSLAAVAAVGGALLIWAIAAGPLAGRFVRMDEEWLATLTAKDYLFPLQWPPSAWLVNLAYVPIILWGVAARRTAGALRPRELALVAGALSLLGVFAAGLIGHGGRVALAFQLQPARIFWPLDFLATVYAIWLLAEGRAPSRRRSAAVAAVVLLLTLARGSYVAYVRFPERSFAQIDVPANDWGRAMAWARASARESHWLADPFHASRYGTSVRVAGQRDVFVEETKDAAIGMYDRTVAMRTRDRMVALGSFGDLTAERARDLARQYDLDYLVSPHPLSLPVVFTSGQLRVYQLR